METYEDKNPFYDSFKEKEKHSFHIKKNHVKKFFLSRIPFYMVLGVGLVLILSLIKTGIEHITHVLSNLTPAQNGILGFFCFVIVFKLFFRTIRLFLRHPIICFIIFICLIVIL